MRKIIFENEKYYHIYNRGVEKHDIFRDDKDRFRFIHDLYEFNNKDAVLNNQYYFEINYGGPTSIVKKRQRKLLVNILCFCLMPNHYHLILQQLVDNGISTFMQKLGSGYVTGFNLKYKRIGPLFQGRYKAITI